LRDDIGSKPASEFLHTVVAAGSISHDPMQAQLAEAVVDKY
jgi:hypothetical protein